MQNTQQPALLGQATARQIRKGAPHDRLGNRKLAAYTVDAQAPTRGEKVENPVIIAFGTY